MLRLPFWMSRRFAINWPPTIVAGLPFIEIHVATPIATCEQRDPKGLYKKARAGELKNFTGIDDPYEEPLKPELAIDATNTSPQQATVLLVEYLEKQGLIRAL